jgi:cytoskeletal protein CcmA (bactofilin family)
VSIWNKKEEQPAPRPAAAPPATPPATPVSRPTPEIRKETVPVSSIPHRVDSDTRNNATIGKAVRIVGQIFAKEDLNVDGDVEGTIESTDNKVTIGSTGRVQASVKAREVVILGQVQGNVEATDKVDIRREAKLVGDITTARISIEDGALFKGSIDIRKPEPKPTAAAPAPQPAPSVSSASASASAPAPAAAAATPVGR